MPEDIVSILSTWDIKLCSESQSHLKVMAQANVIHTPWAEHRSQCKFYSTYFIPHGIKKSSTGYFQ